MANELTGKRVAFLATDMVEQSELEEPWKAVEQAGGTPELISLKDGEIHAVQNDIEKGKKFKVDRTVEEADASDYDALVQPGGVGNPDRLCMDENAVRFVRDFFEQGKPVAAICHGPWMLVEADVLKGRTITSFWSIKTDIRNAGGTWVDEEVHVEDGVVTSRYLDDLPAFNQKLVEEFAGQRATTRIA